VTEGRDDCGLDGLAVAIGDQALADTHEAELAAEACMTLREQGAETAGPRVLFVQAKRNPICSNNEVKLFGVNALDFLTMSRRQWRGQKPNAAVQHWWEIFDRLRSVFERHGAPFVVETDLVFAYAGIWSEEKTRPESSRLAAERRLQEQLGDSRARFTMWGAAELADALRHTTSQATNVLRDASFVELPPAPAKGYLGHAPARSILALLPETAGSLDEGVFSENVRSFLGLEPRKNPGAAGLARTLESGAGNRVILLHNGLTIIARDAEWSEGALHLTGYQVVNGAQTAHVLHEHRGCLDDVHLAVKVVVTEDDDLLNEVIRGANTQSPVDEYDMLSRIPMVRRIETHFLAFSPSHPEKLWLQRRRGERFFDPIADRHRILTPRHLLEAYAATLLKSPHALHASAGQFLDHAQRGKIFGPDHSPTVYRALGWLVVAARNWADRRSEVLWVDQPGLSRVSRAYPARHQFLYALWLHTDPGPLDSGVTQGAEAVEARFGAICRVLADPAQAKVLTNRAGAVVRGLLHRDSKVSDQVGRVAFTRKVREAIRGKADETDSPPPRSGKSRKPRKSKASGRSPNRS